MAKPMHDTERLGYDGAVDADGHVLEPPDLWERYIDPQHRDRALRIVRDERDLEELEIGGQRSLMSRRGFPSTLGATGAPDMADIRRSPERTYLGKAPFGSRACSRCSAPCIAFAASSSAPATITIVGSASATRDLIRSDRPTARSRS
jgi:hypothetical protein